MRSQRVTILLTPQEKAAVTAKAAKLKVTTSELLRLAFDAFDEAEDRALLDGIADQLELSVSRARTSLSEARSELSATLREARQGRRRAAARAAQQSEPD
jgi:predicted ATPase